MLIKKKKEPKFKKNIQGKQAPLEKQNTIIKKTPKINPYRNEEFLEFVRSRKCCIPGCTFLSVPHHLVRKKLGVYDIPLIENGVYIKGGVVNLCCWHHNLKGIKESVHQMGDRLFQKKFNIDFEEIAIILWKAFKREIEK